jgi:outer membrane protein assembly factor BamB
VHRTAGVAFCGRLFHDDGIMKTLVALLTVTAAAAFGNWPVFRGPTHQGISTEANLPVEFGPGKNHVWTAEIEGAAWSSPVIWQNRIFVTTATEEGRSCRLLALDFDTGKVLWDREITRQDLKRKERKNSYATPTPVTDGRAVYAVCGNGAFAAYDFSGKQLWVNADYPFYSQHGLGASPVLAGGLLIMARDGSAETGDLKVGWQIPWDRSFIVALDPKTGRERWKTPRGKSRIAHTTANARGGTLFSSAGDVVQAYDLKSGRQLWSSPSQGEGVVPSPVLSEDLVFTVSGFEKPTIRAHRLDGALAWEQTRGVPMMSSLLYENGRLYAITTAGILHCFDARTGEPKWQGRVGGDHSASPILAAGRLYFSSEQGEITVVKAGDEFEVLARNALGEAIQASPAASRGRLLVRTARKLHCFQAR